MLLHDAGISDCCYFLVDNCHTLLAISQHTTVSSALTAKTALRTAPQKLATEMGALADARKAILKLKGEELAGR